MPVDLSYLLGEPRAQPQTAPSLRRDGLLRRAAAWMPLHPDWGMRDMVSGRALPRSSLAASGAVRANAWLTGLASGSSLTFDSPAGLTTSTPFWITWLQQPGIQSSTYPHVASILIGGTDYFAVFGSGSDSAYAFVVGRLGSTAISFSSAVGLLSTGSVDRFLLTSSGGPTSATPGHWTLWRNGVRLSAGGNIATAEDSGSGGRIGNKIAGAYQYVGLLGDLGIGFGTPTEREILDYMHDPYGVAYARPRGVVFVGASGGYSGAVAAASTGTVGSTPTGTQTHVGLVATGDSATAGTAPAGTQTHQGAVAAGASATAGSTPAGTSAYAGAVAAGASATAGSAPAGTQVHAGVVAAAVSATVGSAPAGTQVHVGAVAAGVSATLGSTVAGGGDVYSGTVAAGASATLGSAPAGTQTHVGTVAAGASATVGASPTGTQVHQGVVAAGVSVTVGSTVAGGGSVYSGAVADGATATAGSAPAGTQIHVGVVGASISATLGSAPAGTQIYVGAVAAGVSATVGGTVGAGGTASAAEVWAYELSPGVSAQQYVLEIHAMLTALSALAPCPTADAIASAVWSRELPL